VDSIAFTDTISIPSNTNKDCPPPTNGTRTSSRGQFLLSSATINIRIVQPTTMRQHSRSVGTCSTYSHGSCNTVKPPP
jgi:hypothetical protein